MGILRGSFALVFLLAAAVSLVHLLSPRIAGSAASYLVSREADAVHLYMNATMALMFSPYCGLGSRDFLIVLYAIAVAALAARILFAVGAPIPQQSRGAQIGESIYHLFGTIAMLYAIWLMARAAGNAQPMNMMEPQGPGWGSGVVAVLFLLDGLATGTMLIFFPSAWSRIAARVAAQGGNGAGALSVAGGRDRFALSIVFGPHLIMDLGMAAMLFGWPAM